MLTSHLPMYIDMKTFVKNKYDSNISQKYYDINDWLNTLLVNVKNIIDHHAKIQIWDKVKKLSNDYESIYLKKVPVSRSYYKFMEIWKIIKKKWLISFKGPIKTCHICEAPGGFIEALLDIAQTSNIQISKCTCISLISADKKIPIWRLGSRYVQHGNISFCEGVDGTGDIYNLKNINDFIKRSGKGQCSIITADGGFDFSNNYNMQETSFARMLACEIYIGLHVQCKGGVFVLKIFDMFSPSTISIIYILQCFYQQISIVKPCSSRPANSERYLICGGFLGLDEAFKTHNSVSFCYKVLREVVTDFENKKQYLNSINIPMEFLDAITESNVIISMKQILNIYKTFMYIDIVSNKNEQDGSIFYDEVLKKQSMMGVLWYQTFAKDSLE